MKKLPYETYLVPDFDDTNGHLCDYLNKIYENRNYIQWEDD